jgi:SAM-dependent methyltransferase
MSVFTSVDSHGDPSLVVSYLDQTAEAESGMKHYVAAAHARHHAHGLVLDLGCGAGHDLVLLADAGLQAVGVDPSSVLLRAAAQRIEGIPNSLVRAVGESLPFRDGSFDGCRIERVLMHVANPLTVLTEVVRCVRSGGLVTVFEPDWSRFRVREDSGEVTAGWMSSARHPGIGGDLWKLLERADCELLDRVEELSVWRSLETLDMVIGLRSSLRRAVEAGRISGDEAEQWVQRQTDRQARGEFLALASKVLVVATTR